jgi:hypothetical protein
MRTFIQGPRKLTHELICYSVLNYKLVSRFSVARTLRVLVVSVCGQQYYTVGPLLANFELLYLP